MLGKQTDLLAKLIAGASSWRTSSTTNGVTLTQINAVFPDGKAVTLFFNEDANDWEVTA